MGLSAALYAAVSGLRTTQAGINLVSQNVANADSVGYTRRRMGAVQQVTGDRTSGVRAGAIERVLDQVAQRQLRLETSGAAYTSLAAGTTRELDRLFGQPGTSGSLDHSVNQFTEALQRLVSNPSDTSIRGGVLDRAGALASRLSSLGGSVQNLRSEAEGRLATAVSRANDLLSGIAGVNTRIVASVSAGGTGSAALLDERDRMINELSRFMDVQTVPGPGGSISVSTASGQTLFDGVNATRLEFDARSNLGPTSTYSTDPATRSVGTITAISPGGQRTDLLQVGAIRSGEIAAGVQLRDETLVRAQRQLDELAAGLARSLSDRPAPVTSVAGGGFDIDLSGLQAGNAVTLETTVNGRPRRVVLVPTTGAAPNPIPASETNDPNAVVIRVNIAGGPASAAALADIQAGLASAGIGVNAAAPGAPNVLRFTDGAATVGGVSAGVTVTGFTSGGPQLPFFVDSGRANAPYTGSFEGGSHLTGFAQRIAVNPQLTADRSRLVVYNASPTTPQGDTTRPQFLVDALTRESRVFAASSGVGGTAAPYATNVADFARRVVETQGAQAEMTANLDEGQQVALATIEGRFAEVSGVSIDEEMAQLVQLQTAYGANARVLTAVKDMMDTLLRI